MPHNLQASFSGLLLTRGARAGAAGAVILESAGGDVFHLKAEYADGAVEELVQGDFRAQLLGSVVQLEPAQGATCTIQFPAESEAKKLYDLLPAKAKPAGSHFQDSRDVASVAEYFRYYGHLSQQQNMLTDYTRTGTYQRAILANAEDFRGKVVCDVGAGTGILSFFAAQAGARKVYAIEASGMAVHAKTLVERNGLADVITVLHGKCEELELPEPVDVIISEPMGIMLVNERMLESFIYARKWLKPGGRMFPSTAAMFACPFSDEQLYLELQTKAQFWTLPQFFGVDISSLHASSVQEIFRQPIVEFIDPRMLLGTPVRKDFDFLTMAVEELHQITIPFRYVAQHPVLLHGVASWFDVAFKGSAETVILSTSPFSPLTHWYQVRCVLDRPIMARPGHAVAGAVAMVANRIQSYDVTVSAGVEGGPATAHATINLKEPNFRFGTYTTTTTGVTTEASFAPSEGLPLQGAASADA